MYFLDDMTYLSWVEESLIFLRKVVLYRYRELYRYLIIEITKVLKERLKKIRNGGWVNNELG
jgi:hypothetical protein